MLINTNQALECCIEEAAAEASSDQRIQQRYPFFCPINITKKGDTGRRMSAFSRDVSSGGIGLFHNMPLDTGHVTLHISLASGRILEISTNIKWCVPAGDGWYFSGGGFLKLSATQVSMLLIEVIKGDTTRRIQHRYPYYRPITLTIGGDKETVQSVFGRDISWEGIGLLHNMTLDSGRVILHLPSMTEHDLGIRTEIKWSTPVGEGWYVSGHEFVRLVLEEVPTRLF